MPFFPSLPADASVPQIFNAHPDIYRPFSLVNEAIMRGPSPLTPGERELIGAYVSGLNACAYCAGGHAAAADAFGIALPVYEAILADIETAPVAAKLKPILAYVKKLTETPARLTQADADTVFAAGWSEKALHDAIAVACMFAFMNRLVNGHGIVAYPEKFAERGRRHKELGYIKQFTQLFPEGKAAE